MGLIGETAAVFDFLRGVFASLPVAVQLLVTGTFGGMIYIAVLRSFRG